MRAQGALSPEPAGATHIVVLTVWFVRRRLPPFTFSASIPRATLFHSTRQTLRYPTAVAAVRVPHSIAHTAPRRPPLDDPL